MTRPINIYLLSHTPDETAFNTLVQRCLQNKNPNPIENHEIESLQKLVDEFKNNSLSIAEMDGFFYSFKIPRVGKEFDLLKITDNLCINIELKSTDVGEETIRKQLLKNQYYLNHLKSESRDLKMYSIITDTMKCYEFINNELQQVELSKIITQVRKLSDNYYDTIDNLFKPSAYLVSPLNRSEEFLQKEYFLTEHQNEKKKKIISNISSGGIFLLSGKAGTGKTLLIYDLARTCSKMGRKTLIIHCNKLPSDFANEMQEKIDNLTVIEAYQLKNFRLNDYDCIFIDESQRIWNEQFEQICDSIGNGLYVFSFDSEQVLSERERSRDIVGKIRKLDWKDNINLTDKIRTNKRVTSFISHAMNLKSSGEETSEDYTGIDLCYASTPEEAYTLLQYFKDKDYIFINYSKSNVNDSPYDQYVGLENYDTHHIMGQEFDKVVMLMDSSFYYDDNGMLRGKTHPTPNYLYPKLFYQGITRAREYLAIIVIGDPGLFDKMVSIIKPAK